MILFSEKLVCYSLCIIIIHKSKELKYWTLGCLWCLRGLSESSDLWMIFYQYTSNTLQAKVDHVIADLSLIIFFFTLKVATKSVLCEAKATGSNFI